MPESKVISLDKRAEDEEKSFFEQLLQEGARKLLQAAIENEVMDYIQLHKDRRDENGQRLVVRNGHLPAREIVSGIGSIKVRQPRVRHRDGGRFTSAILPRFMRRTPSVDALIPALYLKGISTGDFTEALAAILGEKASGLSATNIVRLKAGWEADYKAWSQRDLSQKRYVYWWADGVYFNVRLDEERTCVLVLIGATEDGTKELLAVVDGYRESAQSWRELLQQLKRLGLSTARKLAIGDGSLGFWIALQEEYGPVAQQRCWVHKTANILDKMPSARIVSCVLTTVPMLSPGILSLVSINAIALICVCPVKCSEQVCQPLSSSPVLPALCRVFPRHVQLGKYIKGGSQLFPLRPAITLFAREKAPVRVAVS